MRPQTDTTSKKVDGSTNPTVSPKGSLRRFLPGMAVRVGAAVLGLTLLIGGASQYLRASDHDDGETDSKGRNLNLTDLFVFREVDQNAGAAATDLIFIMNTNPRSLARQQYYFSNRASYDFRITRVPNRDVAPTGVADTVLRFEFGTQNAAGQQDIKVSLIQNGVTTIAPTVAKTTPLGSAGAPIATTVTLAGLPVTVFSGLREDPFFFDVESYFRVRAGLAGLGPSVGFRPPQTAVDFTKGYNVNSIVVRVPRALLQQGNPAITTFDVWETISIRGTQVERLARPVINEGLILTNDFLNAFNAISPDQDLSAAAAPVRAEAKAVLKALPVLPAGFNSDARADTLLRAFLPDVMRIDTTQVSNYSPTIPAICLNALGSPICGRKITDDVFDLTIGVLTNGAVTTDNVSYTGTVGNPAQGHQPPLAGFPYLALPN